MKRKSRTMRQYLGDMKRSRTAALRRARIAKRSLKEARELNLSAAIDIFQRRVRWGVQDAKRAQRSILRMRNLLADLNGRRERERRKNETAYSGG